MIPVNLGNHLYFAFFNPSPRHAIPKDKKSSPYKDVHLRKKVSSPLQRDDTLVFKIASMEMLPGDNMYISSLFHTWEISLLISIFRIGRV